jgi:hypothetical protein
VPEGSGRAATPGNHPGPALGHQLLLKPKLACAGIRRASRMLIVSAV